MLRVAYELLNVCKDENGQSVKRYARDELRHLEDAWRRPSKDRVGRRETRTSRDRKFRLFFHNSNGKEWSRSDFDPERRVSPARGTTHACSATHGAESQPDVRG